MDTQILWQLFARKFQWMVNNPSFYVILMGVYSFIMTVLADQNARRALALDQGIPQDELHAADYRLYAIGSPLLTVVIAVVYGIYSGAAAPDIAYAAFISGVIVAAALGPLYFRSEANRITIVIWLAIAMILGFIFVIYKYGELIAPNNGAYYATIAAACIVVLIAMGYIFRKFIIGCYEYYERKRRYIIYLNSIRSFFYFSTVAIAIAAFVWNFINSGPH